MAAEAYQVRLLENQPFRRLLLARFSAQTGQNALLYALLILVVEETGSSIHATILLLAFALPSVLLALPAGALVDVLPKRGVMVIAHLLRAAIAAALVYYEGDIWWVYLLALAFSSVNQFFSPAESASLPALVRRDQLAGANALMNFVLMLGQVGGMVIMAPFLLKTIGAAPVFTVAASLYLAAAWMPIRLGGIRSVAGEGEAEIDFLDAMAKGIDLIRTNRRVFLSIVYLTASLTLVKIVVVLAPRYTEDVLEISAEDMVFVAAPAAIGALAGLVLAPLLARFVGAWRVVALGFLVFIVVLMGMGLVVYVRDFLLDHLDFGISYVEERVGVSSVITITMLLAIPLGLAFSLVGVAARAVLNQEAPLDIQGRVFATQSALADLASLLPLLAVGAIAELVGVRAMLLAVAILALAVAAYVTFSRRFRPQAMTQQPEKMG